MMTNPAPAPEPEPEKPRWKVSYAYDVPYYFDFCIAADTEAEAQAIAERLLADGKLDDYDSEASPCYDNADNARVFTSGDEGDYEMALELDANGEEVNKV